MAKGRKTGGRDFAKGNPGRRVGAKDKVPRGCLRAAIARLQEEEPELVYDAMCGSLKDRRARVGMLGVLAKIEGEVVDVPGLSEMAAMLARKCVDELHPGPTKGA